MNYKDYLKEERLPSSWCGGCGNGLVLKTVTQVFEELNYKGDEVVVVSGIGCSGRSAGYFNLDTVHGCHGRAIPLAEGIKAVNDNLKVVVVSGDGDLLSIGGNHLLHSARRNTDLCVICIDNEIYGMTGGQKSCMTKKDVVTITCPEGNRDIPMDVQAIIRSHGNFYARTTVFHVKHMKKCITEALNHKGFAFVDIKSVCPTNDGRRRGFKTPFDMFVYLKENFKIKEGLELEKNEIGILK